MARLWTLAAAAASFFQLARGQDANPNCTAVDSDKTYDYVIIGSGPGGMVTADRLSEAGHSVLLIEKGPLSSGRWNGTMKPTWLEGTNLTRFDVPGLFNQIWADSSGVACEDLDVMAGCVLGGGAAVNSALWWKPHPRDWDLNFPEGWKNKDMQTHVDKVWQRIPGTYIPSRDGKLYLQQGFETLSKGLEAAGFKYVVPNDHPDQKNHTYGHSTFFLENAERHGPLATYLVSAAKREKFSLWTNTNARRLVRTGGHVTGVELQCAKQGSIGPGYSGVVKLTPGTGRVIVSAGTMGSAKLLMRSGIGPEDSLNIVKNSEIDGPTMISSDQWIKLPVGYNLNDHVGTDIQIAHPDVVFYDFYGAWDNPIPADVDSYLKNRSGMLAQVAPNLGPMFWQTIEGSDGIVRHIQWQARVEGRTNTSMTITQYIGTGTTSRGRMNILGNLNTRVQTPPYLRDAGDKEAVIQGIDYIRGVFSKIQNLTWIAPRENQTTSAFVNLIPATPGSRGSNHWTGSCTIGTDDGRAGGKAVVDLDTKVYGTDNVFVVDASIFPGMITGNPTAAIIAVAERASERILALKAGTS
ncbi:FAD/NAD(P)-binding domain-containing protein [Westerdykella ornata]|uniref:FAD/NAD(P)-binding domain-containing protein n=1 Tax=Westerdykella ornata TaxID=318751 RepID=A0A6A6JU01_WESOR|nr:FAD/NAD(P)-binding domain-containing protein [Westerdykella ornata]KAF2279725.1 FAD/NAD(P)-binding domain-containing protein [Westerdykella ornata]